MQGSRQARSGLPRGQVALGRVAFHTLADEVPQQRQRAHLARTPALTHAAVPGDAGQQRQGVQRLTCHWMRRQVVRRRLGRADGMARQCAPERGEHPIWSAIGLGDCPGFGQQRAIETACIKAVLAQRRLDRLVALNDRGLVKSVPVHRLGAAIPHQLQQGVQTAAATNDQCTAPGPQLMRQRRQRMVQPPATGSSRRPLAFLIGCVDVDRNHPLVLRQCGEQSRVVGQSQVSSEPDQGGGHVSNHRLAEHLKVYAHAQHSDADWALSAAERESLYSRAHEYSH